MLVIDVPRSLFYMKASEKIRISEQLEQFMKQHNMLTVAALLENEDAALLKMEGFGWRLMKEVLKLREV
jgi:DNA-directed RNA polymerase alpha subunit